MKYAGLCLAEKAPEFLQESEFRYKESDCTACWTNGRQHYKYSHLHVYILLPLNGNTELNLPA